MPSEFVEGVRLALHRLDEDRYQDQLDVLLLGGTVPAQPIPQPDPKCQDCSGTGWVCRCHGIAYWWAQRDHRVTGKDRCACVRMRQMEAEDAA